MLIINFLNLKSKIVNHQSPAGKHKVEFMFEPQVIKTSSMITLVSGIGILLLLIGGIYFERKRGIKI